MNLLSRLMEIYYFLLKIIILYIYRIKNGDLWFGCLILMLESNQLKAIEKIHFIKKKKIKRMIKLEKKF